MDNPLSSLLNISMENLKRLVDVNTIVGSPIISDEATIIPVSKVKLGFLSGGSEIGKEGKPPFGGASGSNMTIEPVCFIVILNDEVKIVSINNDSPLEYIIKTIPKLVENTKSLFKDEEKGVKV